MSDQSRCLTAWRNGCEIVGTSKAGARPFPQWHSDREAPVRISPMSGMAHGSADGSRSWIYAEGALHLTGVVYEIKHPEFEHPRKERPADRVRITGPSYRNRCCIRYRGASKEFGASAAFRSGATFRASSTFCSRATLRTGAALGWRPKSWSWRSECQPRRPERCDEPWSRWGGQ